MFQLVHAEQDCTGQWQRLEEGGRAVRWWCSACGAAYPDSTAVRFAVLREYDLELVVTRLVREGRHLLGGGAGGPAPREDGP